MSKNNEEGADANKASLYSSLLETNDDNRISQLESSGPPEPPDITNLQIFLFAASVGITIANLYYTQPLLGQVADFFHITYSQSSLMITLTQIGYALGMITILPLADIVEKKRLVCVVLYAETCFLLCMALSSNYYFSLVICFLIGYASVTPQLLTPIAARMARPQTRGKAIGGITSGLLIGILASRIFSGLLGDALGWRAVFFVATVLAFIVNLVLYFILKDQPPTSKLNYPQAMKSLFPIYVQYKRLRIATYVGLLIFGCFHVFWTNLTFLIRDEFGWGSKEAGLFGVVGLTGAMCAPIAGKITDKKGPDFVIVGGALITVVAYVLLLTLFKTLAGLIIAIVLLDAGVQSCATALQVIIQNLTDEARSRVTSIFVFFYFIGGSIGSFSGSLLYQNFNWYAVGSLGTAFCATAGLIQFFNRKKPE